jgi:molybdopterin-guanine dinucleotide biosynthesis protein B
VSGERARAAGGRRAAPAVVAVSGPSGSGKTRLLSRLVPALARRGIRCAVVKHTRHPHAFDRPGKDTDVLRRAGAVAAAIAGPEELAFFGAAPRGRDVLGALVAMMPPVPLVLAEGFRDAAVPRIEVHRRAISRAFLCADDPRVFAIVTDEPAPRAIPAFAPDDVEPLAALLQARVRPRGTTSSRARLPRRSRVRTLPAESGRTVAPRERGRMAKTTSRKSGSRSGRRSSSTKSRSSRGSAGGRATLRARGPEFYSEIGRKGGKRSAAARRSRSSSGGRGRKASSRSGRRSGGSRGRSRSSR